MLHGVLNHPESEGHAFFYLRDPAWVASLPEAEREHLRRRGPRPARQARGPQGAPPGVGPPGAGLPRPGRPRRSGARRPRRPRRAAVPRGLDARPARPRGSHPRRPRRQPVRRSRRAPGAHRPARRVRGRRTRRRSSSPARPAPARPPLVANWARGRRVANPDDVVIEHYVGATPAAADWRAMVGRLVGELDRRHGVEPEAAVDVATLPERRRRAPGRAAPPRSAGRRRRAGARSS